MKNIQLEINIRHLQLEELNADERELVEAAIKATDNSYAKYSHFRVGAALRLGNGRMVIGANQENAVFPLGLCAERTAIFAAQANYPDQPVYVHFYSPRWICRVGNYRTLEEAQNMLTKLRELGLYQATIVKGKITVQE